MSVKTATDIVEHLDAAWLNLSPDDVKGLVNPFLHRSAAEIERPDLHLLKIMRNPKYLGWVCKTILNIDMTPMHIAILQELWNRPFSMFIASRGFAKSTSLAILCLLKNLLVSGNKIVVCGAAFRQSKVIFEYMVSLYNNAPIYRSLCDSNSGPRTSPDRCSFTVNDSWTIAIPIGEGCLHEDTMVMSDTGFISIKNSYDDNKIWGNGKFEISDEFYNNGVKHTTRITTEGGYYYIGTSNHRMKIFRDNKIDWIRTDEIKLGDKILIDRTPQWHNGEIEGCTKNDAYFLGAMLGNGHWTNPYRLGFACGDPEHFRPYLMEFNDNWKYYPESDEVHWLLCSKPVRTKWLRYWGMKKDYCDKKSIPQKMLNAQQELMTECLAGLFDTDGTLQVSHAKGGTGVEIGYCSTSRVMAEQVHQILLKYGIVSTLSNRMRSDDWKRVYELLITGNDSNIFAEKIGFRMKRKMDLLNYGRAMKKRNVSYSDTIPGIRDALLTIAKNHKSCDKNIGYTKIKSRQNITFPFLIQCLNAYKNLNDTEIDYLKMFGDENIFYDTVIDIKDEGFRQTYDMHIPNGHEYTANGFYSHNSKIRGLRAHIVIADEFNSIRTQIYEQVIGGFGAVSASPMQNVKDAAKKNKMIQQGIWNEELADLYSAGQVSNQSIVAGTMGYSFEPMATYWKKYKSIIESNGDEEKLLEIYDGDPPKHISYKDFGIIRVPYELVPEGFMDDKQISRAKATSSSSIYISEYGCCPIVDSEGFYRRSLIESCTATDTKPIIIGNNSIWFDPRIKGDSKLKYVLGIDCASESDNFAITALELHSDHTRIVYVWTINRKGFKERVKLGLCTENDYYAYCVRKIRNLMAVFNIVRIGMDAQGGGVAILEACGDSDRLQNGEQVLLPVIEDGKKKDTDSKSGNHLIEMIQFANAQWVSTANHGMRKDMEDKVLLFPRFDQISLAMANEDDTTAYRQGDKFRIYDTLEDCTLNIEELKSELTTIVLTRTAQTQREHFDTPENKGIGTRKTRLKKDRYTSLLISNMLARQIHRADIQPVYNVIGGNAAEMKFNPNNKGKMYQDNALGYQLDWEVGQSVNHDGGEGMGGSVHSIFGP